MSDTHKYRRFSAHVKIELVLAPVRSEDDRAAVREHDISETLLRHLARTVPGGQRRAPAEPLALVLGVLGRSH